MLEVVPDEVLGERPVGAVAAHRGLPHVPVGVDHPGHHDAAGGVDLLGALGHVEPRARRRRSGRRRRARRRRSGPSTASSMVSTVPPRNTRGRPLCWAASDMVIVSSWLRWHGRTTVRRAVSGRRRPPSCAPVRPVKRVGAVSRRARLTAASRGAQQTPRGRTSVQRAHGQEARGMTAGPEHRRRPAGRTAGRRLLPHPRRPLRHDAARRPRRRGGQGRGAGRRRHPHLAAAGPGRRLDLLPGRQPQQALGRPRPQGPGRRRARPGAGPAGRRPRRELQARRPGPVRPGLRRPSPATNPAVVYASISGFGSGPGRRRAARLRPHRAGHLGVHEPDRRHRRRALPGRASRCSTSWPDCTRPSASSRR